jgi:hypothetical protein
MFHSGGGCAFQEEEDWPASKFTATSPYSDSTVHSHAADTENTSAAKAVAMTAAPGLGGGVVGVREVGCCQWFDFAPLGCPMAAGDHEAVQVEQARHGAGGPSHQYGQKACMHVWYQGDRPADKHCRQVSISQTMLLFFPF